MQAAALAVNLFVLFLCISFHLLASWDALTDDGNSAHSED